MAAASLTTGVTGAEARRRRVERDAPSRSGQAASHSSIVRASVFTIFNLILLVAGTAIVSALWLALVGLYALVMLEATGALGRGREIRVPAPARAGSNP